MSDAQISKLYYSISEVGKRLGVETHVLRYWEGEFDQLQPRKNRSGRRSYTEEDIAVAERIQFLVREEKYTIEGARQQMNREQAGGGDKAALRELRAFLVDVLDRLPPAS